MKFSSFESSKKNLDKELCLIDRVSSNREDMGQSKLVSFYIKSQKAWVHSFMKSYDAT